MVYQQVQATPREELFQHPRPGMLQETLQENMTGLAYHLEQFLGVKLQVPNE